MMCLSQLITALQALLAREGDIPVDRIDEDTRIEVQYLGTYHDAAGAVRVELD
jgi:hypothetical protein